MTVVADVLNEAADLIERDGWCQRIYFAEDGRRCGDGAIQAAGIDAHWYDRVCARRAVELVTGERLVDWNDAPGRTQAEVVAALRAAAERAR